MKLLESVLDDCIEELRNGKDMEEVLRPYPDLAPQLLPLLTIAQQLTDLPVPAISPTRTLEAMFRQMAVQACDEPPKRRAALSFSALSKIAAVLVVSMVFGWGAVAASADSVPGDFTYPIKSFTEKARLFLSINQREEAELKIVFSERRLSEAIRKYRRGQGIDDRLLRQMLQDARAALDDALKLAPEDRSYLLSRIGYLAAHQKNVIESVRRAAPADVRKRTEETSRQTGDYMRSTARMISDAKMIPPSCCSRWFSPPTKSQQRDATSEKSSTGCSCGNCGR